MSAIPTLPATIKRYELKYFIPAAYVEPVSDFLKIYCALDPYSESAVDNDYFYTVSSLYFDSPGYQFFKQRLEGKAERFNMRVRAYGNGESAPYFLEIKAQQGVSGIVTKYRATAQQDEWPDILTDPGFRVLASDNRVEKANKELFLNLALSHAIEPKILTKYQRRAFYSTVDNYARVTMDKKMQYRKEHEYNLCTKGGMTYYDNETIYENNAHSQAGVILELKCNVGEVPYWMLDLIRQFELKQTSFSKFVSSVFVSQYDNGDSFMPFDRQPGYKFG